MSGVLAILVVVGLLVFVSAKHAPEGRRAKAEACEATERHASLAHASSPGRTFEAACIFTQHVVLGAITLHTNNDFSAGAVSKLLHNDRGA